MADHTGLGVTSRPMDDDPFDELDLEDAVAVETLMGWDGPTCGTCGAPLAGNPDDDPHGDGELPICGECARDLAQRAS